MKSKNYMYMVVPFKYAQAVYVMWVTTKSDIIKDLLCNDNNIFTVDVKQVFSNICVFWDIYYASVHWPIKFLICIDDLTVLSLSERVYISSPSCLLHCLA